MRLAWSGVAAVALCAIHTGCVRYGYAPRGGRDGSPDARIADGARRDGGPRSDAPSDVRARDGRKPDTGRADLSRRDAPKPKLDQLGPPGSCGAWGDWACTGTLTECTATCKGATLACTISMSVSCTCNGAACNAAIPYAGACTACGNAFAAGCCKP